MEITGDPEIWKRYMKRFAKTVVKVLTLYADVLKKDFHNHVKDESTACVLMNNIQQTRIQLEKTYQSMGGQELEEDAAGVLNQLQVNMAILQVWVGLLTLWLYPDRDVDRLTCPIN